MSYKELGGQFVGEEPREAMIAPRPQTNFGPIKASALLELNYRDLGSPSAARDRFLKHLLDDPKCLASIARLVKDRPTGASASRDYSFLVDTFDLIRCDPPLGNMLLRYPNTLIPILEESVVEAQRSILVMLERANSGDNETGDLRQGAGDFFVKGESGTRVHARLIHLPPHNSCCKPYVSSLVASDVSRMVQISGTVVRTSHVQMYESVRAYQCRERKCNHRFVVHADLEQSNNALPVPAVCPNQNGQGSAPCKGNKFDIIPEGTIHTGNFFVWGWK